MNLSVSSGNLRPLVLSLPAIPQLVLLGLIFVSSVTLNSLSIISIVGARALTGINLLILNLAISDIVYALTIPIFAVHIVIPWWPFGRLGCQLAIAIDVIAMIVRLSLSLCCEEEEECLVCFVCVCVSGGCLHDHGVEYRTLFRRS